MVELIGMLAELLFKMFELASVALGLFSRLCLLYNSEDFRALGGSFTCPSFSRISSGDNLNGSDDDILMTLLELRKLSFFLLSNVVEPS